MDPASCRVIYIDDRFPAEKWLNREMVASSTTNNQTHRILSLDLAEPAWDLQANVSAILEVFGQVFVCNSGRSFSAKLAELQKSVKLDCTPILAFFDVDSESEHDHFLRMEAQTSKSAGPASPSSSVKPPLARQLTFSSEADESYGLQLLSRIASDLQVDEGVKLVIPVALVRMKRKGPSESPVTHTRFSYPSEKSPISPSYDNKLSTVDPQMMLQCLDAGALDVVPSPLNNEKTMGLTVHAYRIYKTAKKEQSAFLASASKFVAAGRRRKQSWVGIEDEKPYAYLREAMVKKLLKGICEPETFIEDYQHRDLYLEEDRKQDIVEEIGKWSFCAHDFSEDELVYAGYYMLNHALRMPELEPWRMGQDDTLRFMQASRVAYNSFVLYHNFRHAMDVLQSLFYFLVQIGTLPPYPVGSTPPPLSQDKSPIGQLLKPFEALTLLISAIGHDVGHPGVNNMFLVKLNAPLAQLYNDQSVLEAFHCAAYSQILRRHWPSAFADKSLRKLLISSILATDMGVHSDYLHQLGNLQEKIHESKTTDGWAPKDVDSVRILTCGLLIKCADISNVARPWAVAERWTHLLQQEFASQGEMENQVGMETTLFGGPPEIGNLMKLANGQIGFMGIFAHPLFANVTDVIPAMDFAAAEIIKNKAIWTTKIEQEKRKRRLRDEASSNDGAISPRSQSPGPRRIGNGQTGAQSPTIGYFPAASFQHAPNPSSPLQDKVKDPPDSPAISQWHGATADSSPTKRSEAPSSQRPPGEMGSSAHPNISHPSREATPTSSSGAFSGSRSQAEAHRPEVQTRRSSNTLPRSLEVNGVGTVHDQITTMSPSERFGHDEGSDGELRNSDYPTASLPLIYDDSGTELAAQRLIPAEDSMDKEVVPQLDHLVSLPGAYQAQRSAFSHGQTHPRNAGRMSAPWTPDWNSMASSGGETYSTHFSATVAPSNEARSFLSVESSDDQAEERRAAEWDFKTRRDPHRQRAKSNPNILSQFVPSTMMGHVPPGAGGARAEKRVR